LSQLGTSNWSLLYGGRISYLGACDSSAYANATASFTGNSGAAWNSPAGSYGYGDVFIGELQFGVQYNHVLTFVPATAFFRIGGEFQYWHVNNGCYANAYASAGPNSGNSLVSASAAAGNSNLALLGLGLSTGMSW
jgi:hypothetical protein